MARIVCVNGGLRSPLNGSLELMIRLRKAGHEVISASPMDLRDTLQPLDIPFVKLEEWVPVPQGSREGRWLTRWRNRHIRRRRALSSFGVGGFSAAMHQQQPDLVLIEIEMREHITEAIASEVPMATVSSFASVWRRAELPPISSGAIPGEGFWGSRLGIAILWKLNGLKVWSRIMARRVVTVGLDRHYILKLHSEKLGVPFVPEYGFKKFLVPDRREDVPVLCMAPLEFDFAHKPPPTMHYLGHLVSVGRVEPSVSKQDIERLEKYLRILPDHSHTTRLFWQQYFYIRKLCSTKGSHRVWPQPPPMAVYFRFILRVIETPNILLTFCVGWILYRS